VNNALTKTRYFPASLIERDILDYNARVAAYTSLLTSYDTLKEAYNAKLAQSDKTYDEFTKIFNPPVPILVPERPTPPSPMMAYQGFSMGTNVESTTTSP